MSTTKPKPKKTITKSIETQDAVKKGSKGPLTAKPIKVVENKVTAVVKKRTNKAKIIRDSFPFPEGDYLKISELKKTCLAAGIPVKKGEILRAGLHLLTKLDLAELKQVVEQVEKVKTGRSEASKIW